MVQKTKKVQKQRLDNSLDSCSRFMKILIWLPLFVCELIVQHKVLTHNMENQESISARSLPWINKINEIIRPTDISVTEIFYWHIFMIFTDIKIWTDIFVPASRKGKHKHNVFLSLWKLMLARTGWLLEKVLSLLW